MWRQLLELWELKKKLNLTMMKIILLIRSQNDNIHGQISNVVNIAQEMQLIFAFRCTTDAIPLWKVRENIHYI